MNTNRILVVCLVVTTLVCVHLASIIIEGSYNNPKIYKTYEITSDIKTHYYNCTITAYSNEVSQTDSTPNETALMERPVAGGTCAVSHDLKQYLGNKIYIYGHGVFRVNDLMNKRYSKRIDLFMGKKEAVEFGRKDNVEVVFL